MTFTEVIAWLDSHAGVANWGLVAAAVITAFIAVRQMRQARELRFSEARPYVIVGMRRVGTGIVELYVHNYGETAAYDVTVMSSPALDSLSHAGWFKTFERLPTLVPGDEWATIWETDTGPRSREGQNKKYTVTLKYKGKDGTKARDLEDAFELDWQPYLESTFMEKKTVHDIGKSLDRIEKTLSKAARQRAVSSWPAKSVEPPSEPPRGPIRQFIGRVFGLFS